MQDMKKINVELISKIMLFAKNGKKARKLRNFNKDLRGAEIIFRDVISAGWED